MSLTCKFTLILQLFSYYLQTIILVSSTSSFFLIFYLSISATIFSLMSYFGLYCSGCTKIAHTSVILKKGRKSY